MQIDERQFGIATELPQYLPARAAGRRQHIRIRRHCDALEFSRAF